LTLSPAISFFRAQQATVTTDNIGALRQDNAGIKLQTSSEQGNRVKYQTRVVSN